MTGHAQDGERPLVVLVEWQAPNLSMEDAEHVAEHAASELRSVPALLDAQFFGDFETGTHCFLLTWRDRDSMNEYMASEKMQSVRTAAEPFVAEAPTRRIFVDYTPPANADTEADA